LEQVDRDIAAIAQEGLTLRKALNTHCHADHITGTGLLKSRLPDVRSYISKASGAQADCLFEDGDSIPYGRHRLQVLATPGHTDGCVSFLDHTLNAVFTGDALLIDGSKRRVHNFGKDLADGECLSVLLHHIDPTSCDLCDEADATQRAQHIIMNAKALGVETFFQPADIVKANLF